MKTWFNDGPVEAHYVKDTALLCVNNVFGFMSPGDLEYLRRTVIELPADPLIVELGSFMGLSALWMAHVLARKFSNPTLYCVDTWEGPDDVGLLNMPRGAYLYAVFDYNMKHRGPIGMYHRPLRMTTHEATEHLPDSLANMVFVDADHSYEHCYEDLCDWWPKLMPGGIFIGHDYKPQFGVVRAVDQFCQERGLTVEPAEESLGTHGMYRIRE